MFIPTSTVIREMRVCTVYVNCGLYYVIETVVHVLPFETLHVEINKLLLNLSIQVFQGFSFLVKYESKVFRKRFKHLNNIFEFI